MLNAERVGGHIRRWLKPEAIPYMRLDQEGSAGHGSRITGQGRLLSKVVGLAAVLAVTALLLLRGGTESTIVETPSVASSYFHLLIPASQADEKFCKTLFSSAALSYPTARILNWQRKFDDPKLIFGGSHIAKIEGILNFLQLLGPQSDNELVLIIDGYDVWFQLKPEVLIQRYHAINARANERIRKRYPDAAETDFLQRVIFSSQKRCWPAGPDDPACFAVPESDLPRHAYGPETDTDVGDEGNPFIKYRQRYLNSGAIMGDVGTLRAIFERALVKATADSNIGSDQGVFASIFGEQEYQREVHRAEKLTWWQRTFLSDPRDEVTKDHPTHHRMGPAGNEPFEFGIGLDYRSELSQPTVFSEDDLEWRVSKHSQGRLSEDIVASSVPFWTFDGRMSTEADWDEVPLYTNTYTDISPVAIHHNAHRDGLKSRIQTFWNETWYFPHLREMLEARAAAPREPAAILDLADRTEVWWGPIDERGGIRVDGLPLPGDWLSWGEVCGTTEIADEVFRDHRGRWTDSINTLDWNHTVAAGQVEKWYKDLDPQS